MQLAIHSLSIFLISVIARKAQRQRQQKYTAAPRHANMNERCDGRYAELPCDKACVPRLSEPAGQGSVYLPTRYRTPRRQCSMRAGRPLGSHADAERVHQLKHSAMHESRSRRRLCAPNAPVDATANAAPSESQRHATKAMRQTKNYTNHFQSQCTRMHVRIRRSRWSAGVRPA